jgi:hypothetical protein
MAAHAKIDDGKMLEMLTEGLSQAAVARHFNVSRQAVSRKLKAVRGQTNPNAAVPAGNEEEPGDKTVCRFCGQESPTEDFDQERMCRYCAWAYGKT